MTDEILSEVATLEVTEEAISDQVFTWVHRVEAQRAKCIVLNSIKEAMEFDVFWPNTQNMNVRTHAETIASIVEQDMCPGITLHTGRNTEKAFSRQSTNLVRDNRGTSKPKMQLIMCTRRVRASLKNLKSMTKVLMQ